MKSLKAYQIETLEREMVALIDHFAPDGVGDLNSERRFFKKFLSDLFSAFDADDSVAHGNCFTCLNQAETWAQLKACVTKHLEILVDSFDMYESYRRSVIAKAELFIERSFREEIAEKDLLSHLRVGKSWFTKVFKEKTGLTFSEYLCKKRVKEACWLLRTTDYPLSAVAHKSGLRTERTLRRAFKKVLGICPKVYKNGQFDRKEMEGLVIAEAELFIERSFREEITEWDLLNHLRVGKSWFTKAFKEKTGLTFSEYLCKRRVKEACRLLRTTDHSISRVAWDSGLRTERTLRRAFKKEFGISPRDYKDGQFVHKRSIRPRRKRQISI